MNCSNCGKEIPEGENKLCEECQNKLLEELSKEESKTDVDTTKEEKKEEKKKTKKKTKKEEVKEENNTEETKEENTTDDEKAKSSQFKLSDDNKNDKKNIIIAAIIIAILLVVGVLLVLSVLGFFPSNTIGNTIGNIRNYGYSTTDGKWIYYLSPSEDTEQVGICKVKANGEDRQELLMDDFDILSINVYKNYIYFIGVGLEEYSETDEVDNKIYRMKKDGTELEVINDNEFNNECYEIYAVNNSIYYIGTDENIYKMNLNGTGRELVANNGTGYIGITNKYIIYNVENEAKDNYITYIMNIDGTNPRPILENKRLYSVDVLGNYVYYTNTDKQIYRTEIDSGTEELVLDDAAYNLNLSGDYLYFLNYLDAENEDYTVALFRVKADGTQQQAENIKTLSSYSTFINVVGDWVMYMDNDSTSGFINLVNKNATGEEKKIYVLDYASYYESIGDEVVPEENNVQTSTEEVTNDNTVESSNTTTNTVPQTNTVENTTTNTVAQ